MKIIDIIDFEQDQIDYIKDIASTTTQQKLMDERYGININYLTEEQKSTVITKKNSIVEQGTSEYLYENKFVRIGKHSLKRIFERVGSNSLSTIIIIIDKIKIMNQVHKAQWKGYPQLSYTLKYKDDPDKYKISLSFKPFDTANFTILVVTVSKIDNLCKPNMEQRINENPILAEKMEKIKQRLKK